MSGRLHDYKLVRAIGKGAFGRTYLASTVGRSKRQVTVEFLDVEPTKIGGVLGALHMRVSQCNELRHPFIARQEGVQNVNGRPALISENVNGCTLGDVTNAGAIPVGVACAVAKKLARALHASYDRIPKGRDQAFNLVHGDLLPSQVWLTTNGRVKLFGVGLTPSEQSRPRDSVRALLPWPTGYSPPESHTGIDVHGGDVYSLAALLAELITGAVPAFASTNEEWHDAVAASTAERVREISGDNQLGFLVSDCLCFNHESRPTAAEVENRLTKICGRHTTPQLSDWAEEVVPPIRDSAYRAAAADDPWNLTDVADEPASAPASVASAEQQPDAPPHATTEEPAAPASNTFALPLEEASNQDGTAEAPPPVSEQGEEMSLLPSDSTDLVEDPETDESLSAEFAMQGPPAMHDPTQDPETSPEEDLAPPTMWEEGTEDAWTEPSASVPFDVHGNETGAPETDQDEPASDISPLDAPPITSSSLWSKQTEDASQNDFDALSEELGHDDDFTDDDDDFLDFKSGSGIGAFVQNNKPVVGGLAVAALAILGFLAMPGGDTETAAPEEATASDQADENGEEPAKEEEATTADAPAEQATEPEPETPSVVPAEPAAPAPPKSTKKQQEPVKTSRKAASDNADRRAKSEAEAQKAAKAAAKAAQEARAAKAADEARASRAAEAAKAKAAEEARAARAAEAAKAKEESAAKPVATGWKQLDTPAEAEEDTTDSNSSAASASSDAGGGGGTVTINGDAASVVLVGGGQQYTAGNVPAGSYRVMVTFLSGTAPSQAASVQIKDGQSVVVTCKASFVRCTIR